jgi:hypothetical protein
MNITGRNVLQNQHGLPLWSSPLTIHGEILDATICTAPLPPLRRSLGYDYETMAFITALKMDSAYVRGSGSLSLQLLRVCGNLVCWRGTRPGKDGRTRIAVNLRLAEPGDVAGVPLQCLKAFIASDLRDGRYVADVCSDGTDVALPRKTRRD